MTEKTTPWWRSFVGKRRKAAKESASNLEQDLLANTATEFSQQPHSITTEREHGSANLNASQTGEQNVEVDNSYDESDEKPTFSQGTNRRNLRISRSGRFKEKRRARVGIPEQYESREWAEPPSRGDNGHKYNEDI